MVNKVFKLWYYTVSHKQMLLRSVDSDEGCNIDIYFGDVSYVEIPTEINGIVIVETEQKDMEYIKRRIGSTDKTITVMMSGNKKYFIVSSVVKIMKNNLSFFELPFDIPNDCISCKKQIERKKIWTY